MRSARSSGSISTPFSRASASPTALTSAEDEERPDATGTVEPTTPSKPRAAPNVRAISCAGAFT